MLRYFIFIVFIFCLFSCSNQNKNPATSGDRILNAVDSPVKVKTGNRVAVGPDGTPYWCDTLIEEYIKHTHNEMIEAVRNDTSLSIGWMLDSRDSVYLVFHLGHDMAEPDGSDPRFATDGWLYIDTVARKVYEYDIAADSLMPIDLKHLLTPLDFQTGDYIINASDEHKVYFHSKPNYSTVRKAFFNTMQKVYVEKIVNGYGFIVFINTAGKKSNGWIEMKDMVRN